MGTTSELAALPSHYLRHQWVQGGRLCGRDAVVNAYARVLSGRPALVLRFVFLVAIQAFLSLRAQSLYPLSACPYISHSYRLGQHEITLEVG